MIEVKPTYHVAPYFRIGGKTYPWPQIEPSALSDDQLIELLAECQMMTGALGREFDARCGARASGT